MWSECSKCQDRGRQYVLVGRKSYDPAAFSEKYSRQLKKYINEDVRGAFQAWNDGFLVSWAGYTSPQQQHLLLNKCQMVRWLEDSMTQRNLVQSHRADDFLGACGFETWNQPRTSVPGWASGNQGQGNPSYQSNESQRSQVAWHVTMIQALYGNSDAERRCRAVGGLEEAAHPMPG